MSHWWSLWWIRFVFVLSKTLFLHVCITQAFIICYLNPNSCCSNSCKPYARLKNNNMPVFHAMFLLATGVCAPAENKKKYCKGFLCLGCCYLYGVNKHLVPVLAVVPMPGATVQTVWARSEPELVQSYDRLRGREGARPDRCVLRLRTFSVFNCSTERRSTSSNSLLQSASRLFLLLLLLLPIKCW